MEERNEIRNYDYNRDNDYTIRLETSLFRIFHNFSRHSSNFYLSLASVIDTTKAKKDGFSIKKNSMFYECVNKQLTLNDWSLGELWTLFFESLNVSRNEVEGNIEIWGKKFFVPQGTNHYVICYVAKKKQKKTKTKTKANLKNELRLFQRQH